MSVSFFERREFSVVKKVLWKTTGICKVNEQLITADVFKHRRNQFFKENSHVH